MTLLNDMAATCDGADLSATADCTQLKALLRVIAASKPGAVAILIGESTARYGTAVLEGLDMSSRLIINVSGDADLDVLKNDFSADIRVAVHAQSSVQFLIDVSRHRFDLTVVDARLLDAALSERILDVMPIGGVVVFVNTATAARPVGWPRLR